MLIGSTSYVGAVKTDGTPRPQQLFNNQRRLLARLRRHHVAYSLGYLLKTDGRFHEQGVDVHPAIDMPIAADEDACDDLVLPSSDTDLLPAVKRVRRTGKTVASVGRAHRPGPALVATCTASRRLTEDDPRPFLGRRMAA